MSTDPAPRFPVGSMFITDIGDYLVIDDMGNEYDLCTCGEWLRTDEICQSAYHDELFKP